MEKGAKGSQIIATGSEKVAQRIPKMFEKTMWVPKSIFHALGGGLRVEFWLPFFHIFHVKNHTKIDAKINMEKMRIS